MPWDSSTGKLTAELMASGPVVFLRGSGRQVGSLLSVKVGGIEFDTDPKEPANVDILNKTVDMQATSGRGLAKMTKKVARITDVPFILTEMEYLTLCNIIESGSDVSISVSFASGSVCRFTGRVNDSGAGE